MTKKTKLKERVVKKKQLNISTEKVRPLADGDAAEVAGGEPPLHSRVCYSGFMMC